MISLIIHGGAWNIPDTLLDQNREGCARALQVGWDLLRSGGNATDAVERAIRTLEDDGSFDAGRGSHLNALGQVELDASIMNGKTLRCGAVAAVRRIRNPITLARKIMDDSEYILLVGSGAEQYAADNGMALCDPRELQSEREKQFWHTIQTQKDFQSKDAFMNSPSDTVGAVALDSEGNICVGTSTGGTPNKHPGRVGDSPLIGCGSYAENGVGGISTTGWGEGMIKVVMAKTVFDFMEHNGGNAQLAAERGIDLLKRKVDGHGGVIVLNARGEFGVAFNTPRMVRAYRNESMSDPFISA